MRILYLATATEGGTPLAAESEIAALKRVFLGTTVEFEAVSSVLAEDLPNKLAAWPCDILHLTAHGKGQSLSLGTKGGSVSATAAQIGSFFLPERTPRFAYLNSCDSKGIAIAMVKLDRGAVDYAFGTTAPISNKVAENSAGAFYTRIVMGGSLLAATAAAKASVQMLSNDRTDIRLFTRKGLEAEAYIPLPSPTIAAAVPRGLTPGMAVLGVRFGALMVPSGTRQIVFFSDDDGLIDYQTDGSIAGQCCAVAKGQPTSRGEMWCERGETWDVTKDFRIFAIGVLHDGRRWTAESRLSGALRRWHASANKPVLNKDELGSALAMLNERGPMLGSAEC